MIEYKRVSNETIIDSLMECYGIVSNCAKKLNVSRQTLAKWIKEDEELTEVLYDARENLVDHVESKLLDNIDKGKEISILFALKCLGKKRGWIDTNVQQLEITNRSISISFEPQNFQEFQQVVGGEQVLELTQGEDVIVNISEFHAE